MRLTRGIVCVAAIAVWASTAVNLSFAGSASAITETSSQPWSIMIGPTPAVPVNGLFSTSCASAQFCMSVGPLDGGGGAGSYEWNGASWNAVAMPDPANTPLWGVSCRSQTFCMAVGSSSYQWNGTAWTKYPLAAGASGLLQGLTCLSATNCVGVGWQYQNGHDAALIERWHNSTWSVVPNPDSDLASSLYSVSCVKFDFCVAVGTAAQTGVTQSLIEQWNGVQWTPIATPVVANNSNQLVAVSCSTTTLCASVGALFSFSAGTPTSALIDMWNGQDWTNVASPASDSDQLLQGVDCYSAIACRAVGSIGNQSLVLKWGIKGWAVGDAPLLSSDPYSGLGSITCVKFWACVTLGYDSASASGPYSTFFAEAPMVTAG